MEIMDISPNGQPEYNITNNLNAARTVGTNQLWPGGSAGLNLDGSGFLIGEWDGGRVRKNHQEFNNGSGSRVTIGDGASTLNDHSTHVAGTLIAEGQVSSAKGMASEADLYACEWNNDVSEMASAYISEDLKISNHSYGRIRGWYENPSNGIWYWYGDTDISETEDYLFGFYSDLTAQWDSLAFECPYLLIVKSAGNDRNDYHSGSHLVMYNGMWIGSSVARDKDGGTDGYDCIGPRAVAKNLLVVGSAYDIPGGWTQSADVTIPNYTVFGPTDDGRIKPDILANGVGLYSCISTSKSAYDSYGGTSMASPNACGSLALLHDYYHSLNGSFLVSSTMKAMVINTANEAGPYDGPDYKRGWGLLNSIGISEMITKDYNEESVIFQYFLLNGQTNDYTFYSTADTDIHVTICWTDPAGTPVAPSLNPATLMLVNDLDLRVIQTAGSTHMPWILNPSSPGDAATMGDNFRDNAEKVSVLNPLPGEYTIRINHKGNISPGQYFSLIVSGLTATRPTNTWTGSIDSLWTNSGNWSLGHSPVLTEKVVIPPGCPHYPYIGQNVAIDYVVSGSGECYSLEIQAGASLKIENRDVWCAGSLIINGDLFIGDDCFFEDGASIEIAGNGNLYTGQSPGRHGILSLRNGSTLIQSGGTVYTEALDLRNGSQYSASGGYFHIYKEGYAISPQNIEINDPDSYFYFFHVDTLTSARLYNCSQDLLVNLVLRISGELFLNGDTVNAFFVNGYGTINLGSGLLNITQTGPVFYDNSSLIMTGGELTTQNTVWFNSGANVNVSGGAIKIRRNLINNFGEFVPTGGKVVFQGDVTSSISGPTSFL